jgi:hypothetical protein
MTIFEEFFFVHFYKWEIFVALHWKKWRSSFCYQQLEAPYLVVQGLLKLQLLKRCFRLDRSIPGSTRHLIWQP